MYIFKQLDFFINGVAKRGDSERKKFPLGESLDFALLAVCYGL